MARSYVVPGSGSALCVTETGSRSYVLPGLCLTEAAVNTTATALAMSVAALALHEIALVAQIRLASAKSALAWVAFSLAAQTGIVAAKSVLEWVARSLVSRTSLTSVASTLAWAARSANASVSASLAQLALGLTPSAATLMSRLEQSAVSFLYDAGLVATRGTLNAAAMALKWLAQGVDQTATRATATIAAFEFGAQPFSVIGAVGLAVARVAFSVTSWIADLIFRLLPGRAAASDAAIAAAVAGDFLIAAATASDFVISSASANETMIYTATASDR